ncbi:MULTISPECIES: hypothetical protein [Metallosphaera]|uniref:Transcriptional regulator n=3 Tax=Metallosphaera TaxID=41980 RepID=A4YID5_METS5|nr:MULTISPECIES: hypothetical protein [Metallosphaera]ABP96187.1 hypothetical protein Msed_2047 [Metallosphaera sedula DSM 5348]AIM28170.1 hypothetical protein HA72_2047 [Metallosphaera sedula]MCH1770679.1 hypothetical protein [Metallosphaera sedula]MCP6728877.1 hypothetical protein [Metallosphaera sedula]MCY0861155.1 hypothetical protein [Metallosphaera prunae]
MITERSLYRLRILSTLLKEGEIPISLVARESRLRFDIAKREIAEMERKGLVEILDSGRVKLVRINMTNRKVIILRNLIEELEDL